ncbi:helix-turn-helix domain-containing protein [Phaeocystidibacter luteus]|uniref:Helix-turn-helix transcriptional regulator n=1 Tax=Phaeocystidibacter luteus TaxID=911197 RepID=A0A6N6RLH2_9FLAO|nr:helix-turn-helix transcriptional regulator [Phaeocystidibacter luteus]KAB2814424.1 helix-turn-helix transcriptional regulator [Phaeocystidibacter luteus]
MEEITKRISEIIEERGMTNAAFADAIDIKRPIISHILSGRNKPSLHVVLQILKSFEDIDPSWLLLGKQAQPQVVPRKEAVQPTENRVEDIISIPSLKSEKDHMPSTLLLIEGDEFRVIQKKS